MKAFNPVVWFEIYVNDMSRAQKFYEAVLQFKLEKLPTPDTLDGEMEILAFPSEMENHGAAGALVKMPDVKPGIGGTLVYFGSEDCSIEEKRIEQAGGKVQQSKQSIGEHGYIMVARDSEGNMFGVHSMA